MVFALDAAPSPTRSPSPPVPVGEVDPITTLDPDYLRQCSEQEATDFLSAFPLGSIAE
jgi:hypothetical protein